jgi:U3 small nucleolar RNA-associated protein 10
LNLSYNASQYQGRDLTGVREMSALAKQLAAIAVKSTHQLDLKAQRAAHGKSLLFDPKIAVSQDFETIFQICYEGWQELCLLESRFAQYAGSLFSQQSKTQERGQMTAVQNKEINMVIQSFLSLVSSRLLLKPAQKAVEWLIRRFQYV